MMQLTSVVDASRRAAGTGSRLAKRDAIAACLRAAGPDEIAIAVAFLSGETRQGKLGVGYATLTDLRGGSASPSSTLALAEVDAALARVAATRGKGAAGERARLLGELFARATREEQDFLVRLLLGELRQGALEGVMVEAIAARRACRWARCGAPRCSPATSARWRAPRSPRARQGSRGSRSGRCSRCSRCSRNRRRTSAMRSRGSARRRSSGSSTARASRCTRRATRCGCTRAA